MRRAAVSAVVLAGAAAAAVPLLGRSSPQPPISPTRPLTVRAVLTPRTVHFGDELTARVDVILDRDAVRVGTLRIDDRFAPLTQLGPAHTTRMRQGRLAVVSVSVSAACLVEACATGVGAVPIAPPPVTVQVKTRRGVTLRRTVRWSPLHVTSRVAAADLAVAEPPFRHDALPPPPGYLIAPGTLARALDLLAALLAAAGVGLATWQGFALGRRRGAPPAAYQSKIELALLRTREVKARPAADRRRALGLLARLLDARDRRLAGAARELAWSEPAPAPEALSALVAEVERTVVS
jgi:hypothetical protein